MQVIVGDAVEASLTPAPGQPIVELATNVDDVTGEVLAHTIAVLLAAGAHDAWASPTVMKKGRPAHTLHALVDPAHVERLAALLLAETGSLGVRATTGSGGRSGGRRRPSTSMVTPCASRSPGTG